jgi:ribokinase
LEGLWGLTPNALEARALAGREGPPEDLAAVLLDRGVQNVVVTLGAEGCYWSDGVSEVRLPGLSVQAKDTTAAGDCFNGALARFLAGGRSFPEALRLANLAAALSVTRLGTTPSLPGFQELREFATLYGNEF